MTFLDRAIPALLGESLDGLILAYVRAAGDALREGLRGTGRGRPK
jgi:hypothetical protein